MFNIIMGWMDIKHLFHGNIQNSFFPFNRSHRRDPESCLGRVFNFKFGPIGMLRSKRVAFMQPLLESCQLKIDQSSSTWLDLT
jgi:hypothetical protein